MTMKTTIKTILSKIQKRILFFALPVLIIITSFQNCGPAVKTSQEVTLSSTTPASNTTLLTQAMFSASKTLLGRLPSTSEINRIAVEGANGYRAILQEYLSDPQFRNSMMREHQNYFGIGGQVAGSTIDYDLPARLGTYLVMNDADYSQIIVANYGVDANFQRTPVLDPFPDITTSTSHGAGVLTTRAYIASLKNQKGFNFLLVKDSFEKFSCASYPDKSEAHPIPQNEISSVVHPWGTSETCYGCHKSMNAKAYLYYFYDLQGGYVPSGTGTTRTDTNTPSNVGHVIAAGQTPKIGGRAVSSVRDMGLHMAQDSRFGPCMVNRYVNFMLGKDYKSPRPLGMEYLDEQFASNFYNVKKLLLEIALSQAYINRGGSQ